MNPNSVIGNYFAKNPTSMQSNNGGISGSNVTPLNKPVIKKSKKGSGNQSFLSSLISEAGGTGGALGGAAIGAGIGSVVPVVGTAIGGLIGAGIGGFAGGTGGRLLENRVRDNEYRAGDALKEGAISGILGAGPGNLLKLGGKGALAAKGIAPTLESALAAGGKKAANIAANTAAEAPLKTSLQGKLLNAGNSLLAKQYGTISKPVARANNPLDTIGKLADFGITKPNDAERIAGKVTGNGGIINNAVINATNNAAKVSTANVPSVLDEAIKSIGLVDSDAKSVGNIVKAQLGRLGSGDAEPGKVLEVMKSLEKRAADLEGKGGTYHLATSVDNDKAKALKAVHDELETNLFNVADANGNIKKVLTPEFRQQLTDLHPGNPQWQKFVNEKVMNVKGIDELRSTMAPFVKISKIIKEGDDNAITFGGRVGNSFIGGAGGIKDALLGAAARTAKNPAARAGGKVLRAAGGQVGTEVGLLSNKGIAGRIGAGGIGEALGSAYGATRAGLPAFSAGMREVENNQGNDSQNTAPTVPDANSVIGQSLNGTQSQNQQSGSPYSRDNLVADIQRDPANAAKYIDYYQQLDSIFNPTGSQVSSTTQSSLAGTANGYDTLDQLEGLYGTAGGGSGKLGGAVQGLLGKSGLNGNVQTYNDLAASSVSQLARALNGSGQVSDVDAAVVTQALPKITDTPAVARAKFAALKQRLANAQQNALTYGGGTDLNTALGG